MSRFTNSLRCLRLYHVNVFQQRLEKNQYGINCCKCTPKWYIYDAITVDDEFTVAGNELQFHMVGCDSSVFHWGAAIWKCWKIESQAWAKPSTREWHGQTNKPLLLLVPVWHCDTLDMIQNRPERCVVHSAPLKIDFNDNEKMFSWCKMNIPIIFWNVFFVDSELSRISEFDGGRFREFCTGFRLCPWKWTAKNWDFVWAFVCLCRT